MSLFTPPIYHSLHTLFVDYDVPYFVTHFHLPNPFKSPKYKRFDLPKPLLLKASFYTLLVLLFQSQNLVFHCWEETLIKFVFFDTLLLVSLWLSNLEGLLFWPSNFNKMRIFLNKRSGRTPFIFRWRRQAIKITLKLDKFHFLLSSMLKFKHANGLHYTLWYTTNAIYWFSVAKLVTLACLFTK